MTEPSTQPSSQTSAKSAAKPTTPAQPAWPAALAVLAVGGLYMALPESLTMGPSWLLLAVVSVLLVPVILARLRGSFALNQTLGYVLLGVVTAEMLWSLYLLVRSLPSHQLGPLALLRSAARCGSPTSWSSLPGTGASMPVDRMRATSVARTPKEIFSFPK